MELKNLKEAKDALSENLKLVFSSKELINHIKDDIFFQLILKLISLLFEIESELKLTKKTSEKMLSEVNVITNKHNTFLDVDITEYYQVKDEINYLDVYLYNIYKKHLKDFTSDINVSSSNGNLNNIDATNIKSANLLENDKKDHNDTTSNSNNTNKEMPFSKSQDNINSQNFNSKININPQEVQEQVYYQIANQKIMQETKSGVFYVYDSKPKIVPLLKKIFYIAFCFNGLVFLLPFLSYLLSAGLILPNIEVNGAIKEQIFTINIFECMIFLLFSLFSLFYGAKNLLKKEKNDNLIYYFNWYFFIFIAIFLAMSLFSLINTFSFAFNSLSEVRALNVNNNKMVWYELYLYSTIASYSFVGLMCLMAIFMSFLNPKKDVARINEKLSQYVNEIKKQQQQQK